MVKGNKRTQTHTHTHTRTHTHTHTQSSYFEKLLGTKVNNQLFFIAQLKHNYSET